MAARHVLDTNVLIHLRDGDETITERVHALSARPAMSAIGRAELESGIYREPAYAHLRRAVVDLMIGRLAVLPFDNAAAAEYGKIVAASGYSRRKLLDRMIAATAIVNNAALVTMNGEDFYDIPGLSLEVWASRAV